jgi:hypothetical protein
MKRKPLSIILLGDVTEAQKWVSFARGKVPVARNYSNLAGTSSFRKQYRPIDGVEITVQSLQGATTIYINAEPALDIYVQDDHSYTILTSPTRYYYTTDVWRVKSLPKEAGATVKVDKIITETKEVGKWNDEQSNIESWISPYPDKKIELLYPHYYYGAAVFTPGATYYKGSQVANTEDYRYYLSDKTTLTSTATSNTYSFKYQPVKDRGYSWYYDPTIHQYAIVYSELDRYKDSLNAPRGIHPFTIGDDSYQGWWSGLDNFHKIGIHVNGEMYYTTSRYDGVDVTYRIESFNLEAYPDTPGDIQTRTEIVSSHPTALGVGDEFYKDPVEIICDVLNGDVKNYYGYLSCEMESTTVWSTSGNTHSVNDPFIKIHLGTSWDNMQEIAQWSGSFFHGLVGDHMTEGYNFTIVNPDLIYFQANTREWTVGPINTNLTVVVLKKENDVWNAYPMDSFSTVEPIDKKWAVIPTTSYSQLYNFETEEYHDMVDENGDPVLLNRGTKYA